VTQVNIPQTIIPFDSVKSFLRMLARPKGREDLLDVCSDYLVGNPGTPVVERWLGEVALVELKRKAHKLGIWNIQAELQILKQDIRGRRRAHQKLEGMKELVRGTPGQASRGGTVVFPASPFGVDSQKAYKEFYGSKSLKGRSLEPVTPEEQAQALRDLKKPHLGAMRKMDNNAKIPEHLKRHSQGVASGILAYQQGHTQGPLGSVVASTGPSEPAIKTMVATIKEVTRRRENASAGASGHPIVSHSAGSSGDPIVHHSVGSSGDPVAHHSLKRKRASDEEDPVKRQRRVTDLKETMMSSTPPGKMIPFVGLGSQQIEEDDMHAILSYLVHDFQFFASSADLFAGTLSLLLLPSFSLTHSLSFSFCLLFLSLSLSLSRSLSLSLFPLSLPLYSSLSLCFSSLSLTHSLTFPLSDHYYYPCHDVDFWQPMGCPSTHTFFPRVQIKICLGE
jgi:hypothetical protein